MTENNHSFVNGSIPGSGQPWRQQYHINNLQSDDITGWTIGESLPDVLSDSQAIITKNRVYLLGGYNGSSSAAIDTGRVATIYTALINDDGTLSKWFTEKSLPKALSRSQAVVIKNRIYLLGGVDNNWNYVSTVYTAFINDDGTLGTWSTEKPLPGSLSDSQAIITKNRIYLLGGYTNSTWVPTVYTAFINDDGTLGEWTIGKPLPNALCYSSAIVTKNRVYLIGVVDNNWTYTPTIYTAFINNDGTLSAWSIDTPLPGNLSDTQVIVTKNRIYLLGGIDNSWNYTSTVYTAPINDDGTLGAWSIGTPLPGALCRSQAIVTRNRVYLLGGYNSSGCVATVYTAPIAGGLNDYSAYYS